MTRSRVTMLDEAIGHWLDAWLSLDVDGACRFCRTDFACLDAPVTDGERVFCSSDCRDHFEVVVEARHALDERDLSTEGERRRVGQ